MPKWITSFRPTLPEHRLDDADLQDRTILSYFAVATPVTRSRTAFTALVVGADDGRGQYHLNHDRSWFLQEDVDAAQWVEAVGKIKNEVNRS